MGKENLGSQQFKLGELGEFTTIVCCNTSKNLGELFSKHLVALLRSCGNAIGCFVTDPKGQIVASQLFHNIKGGRFFLCFLAQHVVCCPVVEGGSFRYLGRS